MDSSRRTFLKGSAAASSLMVLSPQILLALPSFYRGSVPICQGMTNSTSAQFTLMLESRKNYSVRVLTSTNGEIPIQRKRREVKSFSPYAIEKFRCDGLVLTERYRLQVIDNDSGNVIDERNFTALDLDLAQRNFAIVSCANDLYKFPCKTMWSLLDNKKPAMVFFIGDTVYADNAKGSVEDHSGGEENFWNRYADAFTLLPHYRAKNLIPTMATWDDHDFGANNGDSSFRDKEITTFLFNLYWGNEETDGLAMGPGISKIMKFGGQSFFFSDNRSFRDSGHYWGIEQQGFLLENLAKNSRPTWLMDGSQCFGGYRNQESLEAKWSNEFNSTLEKLKKLEASILFASGDVHYSEVMKIEERVLGYQTYEFTSSSIHSYTYPNQHQAWMNPRRVAATSDHNFLLFDTSVNAQRDLTGSCKSLTSLGPAFSQAFQVRRT